MKCSLISTVVGCLADNGVPLRSVAIHYEYRTGTAGQSILYKTRYTESDGLTVVTLGATETVSVGACIFSPSSKSLTPGAVNIASGTFSASYDPHGNGKTWDANSVSGTLQSTTVSVQKGNDFVGGNYVEARVNGTKVLVPQGNALSFSVSQDASGDEFLEKLFEVECFGNSAAIIHWTYH